MRLLLRWNHLAPDAVFRHLNREIRHVAVTPCPTVEWTAQQIIECWAWEDCITYIGVRHKRHNGRYFYTLQALSSSTMLSAASQNVADFVEPLEQLRVDAVAFD